MMAAVRNCAGPMAARSDTVQPAAYYVYIWLRVA